MKIDSRVIELLFALLIVLGIFGIPYMFDLTMLMVFFWNIFAGKKLMTLQTDQSKLINILFFVTQFLTIIYHLLTVGIIPIDLEKILYSPVILLPFALTYIWSIIYLMTLLMRVEKVERNGLITFALIYVLPFGIWWIQPRINKLCITRVLR